LAIEEAGREAWSYITPLVLSLFIEYVNPHRYVVTSL